MRLGRFPFTCCACGVRNSVDLYATNTQLINDGIISSETPKTKLEEMTLDEIKQMAVRLALVRTEGNITQAARSLGLSWHGLNYMVVRYGLEYLCSRKNVDRSME